MVAITKNPAGVTKGAKPSRGIGRANGASPDWVQGLYERMERHCDHLVLYGVDWNVYEQVLKESGERRLRLNYDGENLEIMNVSLLHERPKSLLGRLIETLTLELDMPIVSGGSVTCHREDVSRGLEPDECYWIANASKMLGDRDLELPKDPPPDLAIEVEKSRTVLNRKAIYAKLGVPELWRCNGKDIKILLLRGGEYVEGDKSLSFPFLPVDQLAQFMVLDRKHDENGQVRAFLKWVRKQKFKVS
jgi:Uma2 family endonuclease